MTFKSRLRHVADSLYLEYRAFRERAVPYGPLEVLGPEHEFSIVDERLKPLPIADQVINEHFGEIVDVVHLSGYAFGREFPLHQLEVKSMEPFKSPVLFEETVWDAVSCLLEFLERKHHARLLGGGMHPLLALEDTCRWPHGDQEVYLQFERLFNLRRQGWLNTQSFQLNLPYYDERWGVSIYNALSCLCAYLPAVSAASPMWEGSLSPYVDGRLIHAEGKTREIPSIAGDGVPEYIVSFDQYRREVIGGYSRDLMCAGAKGNVIGAEWMNQRGVILRFSREAVEVRVMDEQECIKSDVALSCFIRAAARGLMVEKMELPPHELLVEDYRAIVKDGLAAETLHPEGGTAREVCRYLYDLASKHADADEKKYLPLVKKRIEEGSLAEIMRRRVLAKAMKTSFKEATVSVCLQLARALSENEPYF